MSDTPKIEGKVLGFRNWRFVDGELLPLNDPDPWGRLSYRISAVSGADLELPKQSPKRGYAAWGFDTNDAVCRHHDHIAPSKECECGLYAWHGIDRISGDEVAGAVLGWGKTIAHHDGFRSEHAQIVALAYSDDLTYGKVKKLREIAQENGIVVCEFDQLENVGSEFGTPVPGSMRPEKPMSYNAALVSRQYAQYARYLNRSIGGRAGLANARSIYPPPASPTSPLAHYTPSKRSLVDRWEDWVFDHREPFDAIAYIGSMVAFFAIWAVLVVAIANLIGVIA